MAAGWRECLVSPLQLVGAPRWTESRGHWGSGCNIIQSGMRRINWGCRNTTFFTHQYSGLYTPDPWCFLLPHYNCSQFLHSPPLFESPLTIQQSTFSLPRYIRSHGRPGQVLQRGHQGGVNQNQRLKGGQRKLAQYRSRVCTKGNSLNTCESKGISFVVWCIKQLLCAMEVVMSQRLSTPRLLNWIINKRMKIDQSGFKASLGNRNQAFSKYLEAKDYNSLDDIIRAFPHLASLRLQSFRITEPCHSLVIRSGNDDNIHKAIKYGIWTTTFKNKNKLEEYWYDHQSRGTDTYLFFSAVKSGHFEGVARLASGYHEETFPFWWENQHGKFKGHFDIEWLYIKDLTYRHFEGLKNQEGEDVTKSKDCDELSMEVTRRMFNSYANYSKDKSIFTSFPFFDEREKNELRAVVTHEQQMEQQMWYMEQLRQYQLQQQLMFSSMPVQTYAEQLGSPVEPQLASTAPLGKNFVANNPGFQMNPVSKNKKNNKDKS